jgi:hypothetical protein
MFENKRSMAIKTTKYKGGNSFELHCIFKKSEKKGFPLRKRPKKGCCRTQVHQSGTGSYGIR